MKIAAFVLAIMVMCICPGRISEEKELISREQKRPKNCRFPKGNHGAVLIKDCIQSTCANGKWKVRIRTDVCCYKQKAYHTNAVLETIAGADNCSSTTIGCGAGSQLEISHHSSCSKPASEQQVEEVMKKMVHLTELMEKLSEKVATCATNNPATTTTAAAPTTTTPATTTTAAAPTTTTPGTTTTAAAPTTTTPATTTTAAAPTTTTPGTTTTAAAPTITIPMVEGVLVTGGYGITSTELYLPETGKTCSLQSLPDDRRRHSLDNVAGRIILCGGQDTTTSCLEFLPDSSTGSWAHYATLAEGRWAHTSHVFQEELMLMGGDISTRTTEIVGEGAQYNLQQQTRYACSIPDQSSTIITGGFYYLSSVVRYNMQGYVENLPDLVTARAYHGCGYYEDNGDKVLVVAGGWNGAKLSTTELLIPGAKAWSTGESLPRAVSSLSSVNMDGFLLLIGGYDNDGSNYRGEVLKFNGTWTEVGRMKNARYGAAATKIEVPRGGGLLNISACF